MVEDDDDVAEIHVCLARSCAARGGEAVLAEIEELAAAVGACTVWGPEVYGIGCLGACSEAPNALVRMPGTGGWQGRSKLHMRINSLEASVEVVEQATGRKVPMQKPEVKERLKKLRADRALKQALSVFHWNAALSSWAGMDGGADPEVTKAILDKAGFPEGDLQGAAAASMPDKIENYALWSVEEVVPVSKHSCILQLKTSDRKRGTPHPRGSGRGLPEPETWHTTLLAETGPNSEGPLPWIEREYTPISSAKEWEAGRCSILLKVYEDGAATSWLQRKAPTQVWLSQPVKTLSVPHLVPDSGDSFRPDSLLLLLAGTGAVALPQILYHRDPIHQLGFNTPRWRQLSLPIDVVVSYREDDVLLLSQVAQWCQEGGESTGVRNFTMLLTDANTQTPVFPSSADGDAAAAERVIEGLTNARIQRSRLSWEIVNEAVSRMPGRCRVVVSGPSGFNAAARELLTSLVDDDSISVLAG